MQKIALTELRGHKRAPFGSKTLVDGIGVTSRREIRRPLYAEELARLTKVRGLDFTYDGDAEAFLVSVEAQRTC